MIDNNFNYQVKLFKSLFKGREDVFAIRWEKENKSGYMPAYFFDPYMYRKHKISGGDNKQTWLDYFFKNLQLFMEDEEYLMVD